MIIQVGSLWSKTSNASYNAAVAGFGGGWNEETQQYDPLTVIYRLWHSDVDSGMREVSHTDFIEAFEEITS